MNCNDELLLNYLQKLFVGRNPFKGAAEQNIYRLMIILGIYRGFFTCNL